MAVKHVLSDGTILDDISGHVIKGNDAKNISEILGRIAKENGYENTKFGKSKGNS